MRRSLVSLAAISVAAGLLIAGCSQAAPAAAPSAAPAKPAAAAPAAAPAPTQAPAKVDWPQKGKAITWIVPFAAGGGADTRARQVAPLVEKALGTPVEVSDRPGGGAQIGLKELADAKPDGYTIGLTNNPTTVGVYLTPDRQATFNRKSFAPVAMYGYNPEVIAVKADSPYKTLKDFVDAAKAKPDTITAGCNGFMSGDHIAILQFGQLGGGNLAVVSFNGSAEEMVALVGGKIDSMFAGIGSVLPQVKAGEARVLAVMDSQRSKVLPDVPTLEEQGYKIYNGSDYALSAPAGTPPEVVNIISGAVQKATQDPELIQKFEAASTSVRYMNPTDYGKYWDDVEAQVKPIVDIALKQQAEQKK